MDLERFIGDLLSLMKMDPLPVLALLVVAAVICLLTVGVAGR